jgi:hypothetical protein
VFVRYYRILGNIFNKTLHVHVIEKLIDVPLTSYSRAVSTYVSLELKESIFSVCETKTGPFGEPKNKIEQECQ